MEHSHYAALPPPGESVVVPLALIRAPLDDRAKVVWALIVRYVLREEHVGRKQLAAALSCGLHSIDRATAELEKAGWLQVERQHGHPSIYDPHMVPVDPQYRTHTTRTNNR